MHLDHPEQGQFRSDVSGGSGGGECELFLSQPPTLASGVDAPCFYHSPAVLGSARLSLTAVFICGAAFPVQNIIW